MLYNFMRDQYDSDVPLASPGVVLQITLQAAAARPLSAALGFQLSSQVALQVTAAISKARSRMGAENGEVTDLALKMMSQCEDWLSLYVMPLWPGKCLDTYVSKFTNGALNSWQCCMFVQSGLFEADTMLLK